MMNDFELPSTGGKVFRLSESREKYLLLFFYPKDNTPGCTTESQQFRDLHEEFERLGCTVFGISRDSIKSHENFRTKFSLPFDLLSDSDETACNLFGVLKEKLMYGKKVRGIERSTFLIGPDGEIVRECRGVKADGHAQEVLTQLQSLLEAS
ncbi:MAG: peroxiredoxin [Burkholderiales bacterium]|nr:peroxiredoxin [Burkholderiales bacterium]